MTEQKQVFDKRELKALFRELLKPYATTIPEIGNQDNAFNDAIPYLHRIFSGNDNYDWKLQDLFYNFEDQIDGATDKGAEARRVFVLLLKVYILLEYINASYLFDNPFGPLCGKIDGLAAKVKQTCIENNVDVAGRAAKHYGRLVAGKRKGFYCAKRLTYAPGHAIRLVPRLHQDH